MILKSFLLFINVLWASPSYEQEIIEKNKVTLETKQDDQKSFYQVINTKTQEVLKYIRENKEELRRQQDTLRKDFEAKLKNEIAELKKKDPKANIEALRKAANEQRRDLFEKLNGEKKSLEDKLKTYKDTFDDFIKLQKEKFHQEIKNLTAKKKAQQTPPSHVPGLDEFREIPPGPGIVLSPDK